MSKKFDVQETTKKFMSGLQNQDPVPAVPEQTLKSQSQQTKGKGCRSVIKETGEVTKQVGYYVTLDQDKELSIAAIKMDTDKSSLVRQALKEYLEKIKSEGIL